MMKRYAWILGVAALLDMSGCAWWGPHHEGPGHGDGAPSGHQGRPGSGQGGPGGHP